MRILYILHASIPFLLFLHAFAEHVCPTGSDEFKRVMWIIKSILYCLIMSLGDELTNEFYLLSRVSISEI